MYMCVFNIIVTTTVESSTQRVTATFKDPSFPATSASSVRLEEYNRAFPHTPRIAVNPPHGPDVSPAYPTHGLGRKRLVCVLPVRVTEKTNKQTNEDSVTNVCNGLPKMYFLYRTGMAPEWIFQ